MATLKLTEALCLLYTCILFFSGIFILSFSIILTYKLYIHFKFTPDDNLVPFLLIALCGLVHLAVTWIGVRATSSQHDFFIFMFVIISSILLISQLAIFIWTMVMYSSSGVRIIEIMEKSFQNLMENNKDSKNWERLERKLQCCGMHGATDYISKQIPAACINADIDIVTNKAVSMEVYGLGCADLLIKRVKGLLMDIGLVALFSGLFQGFGIAAYVIFYKALAEVRRKRQAERASRLRQSFGHPQNPSTNAERTS